MAATLAATLTLGQTALAQGAAPTAKIASGALRGSADGAVVSFKGIPYAAAPVGANRWRSPQPVKAWTGVRDATAYGNDCAQAPFPPDAAPIQTSPREDCLYLNVWKPATAKPGAKLPVVVWIHGGGFVNGGSSPAVYSGHNFARDGVVFVSINYRLGRYGFFAHPGLAAEGLGGNFGFQDQIAALKWVKANIAQFGGDAGQVTVFGESAGGMSMLMLLQAPEAKGLFHRVIVESGGGRATLAQPTMASAARTGERFAPGLTAAQLRALPEDKVTGTLSMMSMGDRGYSGPMLDGRTLLGVAVDAAAAGLMARVPVIIGANSADGFPMVTDKDKIFAAYGADADAARKLYDADGTTSGLQVGTMTSADVMFIEPARLMARTLSARGEKAWIYRFGYPASEMGPAMGGAPHASEIPYAFDTLQLRKGPAPKPEELEVAKQMHRYWVNFIKTGAPDGAGVPAWPLATPTATTVQMLDAAGARHIEDPYTARLNFVERRAEGK
ncbi:carboxylesterase family protein [Novosphingobium sp. FSY-8]|uniref:Carboxylic ester hydrolase n=2 Tax=Novosphingobium ovatum TaxID=1908523 RepID=A0ABW9X8X2_9SPHN|nr:carboxylesterase family protein [Novosphingobium ovatum]